MDMKTWEKEYLHRFRDNGHTPILTEDGDVDHFGYDPGGYHNGIRCADCGWGRCMWCVKSLDEIPLCNKAAKGHRRKGNERHRVRNM